MQEIGQPNSSETGNHSSKKRKVAEKIVVTVKMQENDKKQQKSEGPPSDCWSWRKYGQKPIKGSPFPRGYYRCSTSKGCSAKKQVERSKTDASMLIITYTSNHNHPGPDFSPTLKQENPKEINSVPELTLITSKQEHSEPELTDAQPAFPDQEPEAEILMPHEETPSGNEEDHFEYLQSPFNTTTDHIIVDQEDNHFQETQSVVYSEDPKSSFSQDPMNLPSLALLKQEENDFYDELEELPTSSFFTSWMRNSFCEKRVIVNPS